MKKEKKQYSFIETDQKSFLLALCIILPFFFLGGKLISLFAYGLLGVEQTLMNRVWLNIINDLIGLGLVVFLLRDFLKKTFLDLKTEDAVTTLKTVGRGLLATYGYRMLAMLLIVIIAMIIGYDMEALSSANQSTIEDAFKENYVLIIILAVVTGPMIEEVVFRYLIFSCLRKVNAAVAVIGSSFIFGSLHMISELFGGEILTGLLMTMVYMALGMALAVLYERRRNLFLCMAVHGLSNAIALFAIFMTS